jgi:glycosyltransferase involved in cell wall biosynthesis
MDHRMLSWKFKQVSKSEEKPDLIIASLPPHDLAYQSIRYARQKCIPAIVDIRDTWPDIFLDNLPDWPKGIGRILLFREFQMVKNTMGEADCLVAVSNSFLEWGLRYGKRNRSLNDQIFYLGYHRPETKVAMENMRTELKEALDAQGDRTVVTYIGTFSELQDPSVISECSRRLEMSDIIFVLTGYGSLYERAKKEAKSQRNIFFPGWLNGDEIDALLLKSKIGICPYSKKSAIFPNKAFMYLSAGIPVVSSYQGDLKEIIESEQVGYYFEPGDVNVLVDAVTTLSRDQHIYEEMSRNAKRVFESRFSEEKIYQDFADFVERIATERRS